MSYFFAGGEGAHYRTNVWAHSRDPRTNLPTPVKPTAIDQSSPAVVDSFVPVVWPHDDAGQYRPVTEAPLVNVGVDLIHHSLSIFSPRGTAGSLGPDGGHSVRLLRSLNDDYLEVVKAADRVTTVSSRCIVLSWPRWHFNNIGVATALNVANRYYCMAWLTGLETHPTIWAHGSDPRIYFPERDVPARSCQPSI